MTGAGDSADPAGGSLAVAFAAVAARHPGRLAVLGGADPAGQPYRYRELARSAGGFAEALRGAGVVPGDRVGLLLDHGPELVAAILGTLAAGAGYVPLDPDYPTNRLRHMVDLADPTAVVVGPGHAELSARLAEDRPAVPADPPPAELSPVAAPGGPDAPAYILFTSGSTGVPKGVAQTHRNVLHGVSNHIRDFRLSPADRLSLVSSFSFDMAVTDMFAALLCGATVVPVDVRRHGVVALRDALAARGVTVYHSTPTLFRHLCDALPGRRLSAVRAVVLGGEPVTAQDLARCRAHCAPDAVFVNGYGATEASFAVQYHLPAGVPADRAVLPIGYPLPGYEILLRAPDGRPAALTGEIVICSRHLAPGYWRSAELTAQRFSTEPDGSTRYRTGDLGRRLPDGRLVYLGRLDRQVKIRGFRVEPGEVEAHLAALPGVARAVAVGRDGRLLAYVQAAPGAAPPDPATLLAALAGRLPDYLVPAVILPVTELPLTPTGKVDVAALPDPVPVTAPASGLPLTATERLVAGVWQRVLGIPHVTAADNFRQLGGDSLRLAEVQRLLEEATGSRIPLPHLHTRPTVAAMAELLDDGPADGTALDRVAARALRRRAMLAERRGG